LFIDDICFVIIIILSSENIMQKLIKGRGWNKYYIAKLELDRKEEGEGFWIYCGLGRDVSYWNKNNNEVQRRESNQPQVLNRSKRTIMTANWKPLRTALNPLPCHNTLYTPWRDQIKSNQINQIKMNEWIFTSPARSAITPLGIHSFMALANVPGPSRLNCTLFLSTSNGVARKAGMEVPINPAMNTLWSFYKITKQKNTKQQESIYSHSLLATSASWEPIYPKIIK